MLILWNPLHDVKDQIYINPAMIMRVHPVCERRSTADPDKTIWAFSVDMADGMSNGIAFDREGPARALEKVVMEAVGPVVVPVVKA
jgi:hypothetical protein